MTVDLCPACGHAFVRRSEQQNRLLHALMRDIAEQKKWAGQWLELDDWKRLLTVAYERTKGRNARIFPALDGHGFDVVYRRTSKMTKQEMSELCEYVLAWGTQNGVKFKSQEGFE